MSHNYYKHNNSIRKFYFNLWAIDTNLYQKKTNAADVIDNVDVNNDATLQADYKRDSIYRRRSINWSLKGGDHNWWLHGDTV